MYSSLIVAASIEARVYTPQTADRIQRNVLHRSVSLRTKQTERSKLRDSPNAH